MARTKFREVSAATWFDLGGSINAPLGPPADPGAGALFTPAHFAAAVKPLVSREKEFRPAKRTAAKQEFDYSTEVDHSG